MENSSFGKRILDNTLDIPAPRILPQTNTVIPHYFVVDAAFSLTKNLMRPYPGGNVLKNSEIFNRRLSSVYPDM
ncbi:unnamed protein product [Hermetia illucens]|uniref:DDE Tnp4 domain-containing protein n=1 Tax=Hermetia illucens TaxID=343691 RepID=A0A7R8YUL8_HERIL|nr:unnamed protein product [Hermetia illucens]